MAITVSNNAYIAIDGTDYTDHCVQITLNDGQESREITPLNSSVRLYRAGMGTASLDATFYNDLSTGSGNIENRLRSCLLTPLNPASTDKVPTACAAALAGLGAGNLAAGDYRYWVTFGYRAFETAPSTYAGVTVASSSANGQVALSSIPTSTDWMVVSRYIYRNQYVNGGTSTAVLLTEIDDNTTTTYTDNATSSSLASATAMSGSWTVHGFPVVVKKTATAQGASNPCWTFTSIIEGDVNLLDEKPGEISQIKVRFQPFSAISVSTTST